MKCKVMVGIRKSKKKSIFTSVDGTYFMLSSECPAHQHNTCLITVITMYSVFIMYSPLWWLDTSVEI